eukprot:TRINITY_DN78894_c0_g1_i1.p1 TRINITY_DN78894_c0_g1~~TRINITY_DN78894_c0_g1_i1.p1  ORF type:complete len:429 (+),score=58.63 TRINITY_DN78894_c0_g1_i1:162-1448(+)
MKLINAATMMMVPLLLAAYSCVAESSAVGSSAGSNAHRTMEAARMSSAAQAAAMQLKRIVKQLERSVTEQTATVNVPYNLGALEASLLAMAQQQTPSSNMEPWLQQVENLTAQMKTQVVERRNLTQTLLDKAWLPFLDCTLKRKADVQAGTGMDALNTKHRTCSKKESEEFEEVGYCNKEIALMKNRTKINCQFLEIYEGNWPINCYEPETSKYTTASDIMDNMIKKFEELSGKWNMSNKSCIESNVSLAKKTEECRSIGLRYNATRTRCSNIQKGMEMIGCGNGTGDCAEYMQCWNTHHPLWTKQQEASNVSQSAYHAEFKSILRIDCLVDAFRLDIAGTQDLTTGVTTCRNNAYNTTEWLQNASISFYPQANFPLPAFIYCNESSAGPSKPGTREWHDFYCTNLSSNTKCENCSSSCCGDFYGKSA